MVALLEWLSQDAMAGHLYTWKASRHWEQRDNVHVSCLAIDNGGTLHVTKLLAIDNGGTRFSPVLLAASMVKQTPFANTLKRDPI
ncbi:hypothetical protein HKD37_02G004347 [Glycine soja]